MMLSEHQERLSRGLTVDFKHVYDPKKTEPLTASEIANYICFVCDKLLRQPQQVSCCGRRACRVCIDGIRK